MRVIFAMTASQVAKERRASTTKKPKRVELPVPPRRIHSHIIFLGAILLKKIKSMIIFI